MAQQEGIGLNVSPADSALSEEESAQAKKKEQSELLRAMEKEALLKLDIPEDRAEELIAFIETGHLSAPAGTLAPLRLRPAQASLGFKRPPVLPPAPPRRPAAAMP